MLYTTTAATARQVLQWDPQSRKFSVRDRVTTWAKILLCGRHGILHPWGPDRCKGIDRYINLQTNIQRCIASLRSACLCSEMSPNIVWMNWTELTIHYSFDKWRQNYKVKGNGKSDMWKFCCELRGSREGTIDIYCMSKKKSNLNTQTTQAIYFTFNLRLFRPN